MAGFNFGTPTSSAPSFALGSNTAAGGTPGFSFGASTPSSSAQTLQFNAPTSTSAGVSFGTPAASGGSGFSFGATSGLTPATQATNLAFTPSGLNFGNPPTTQPTLGFGSPAASTATTGLTFGSGQATTQPALSFGAPAASTQPGLTFGSAPAAATSQPISFGVTQPTLSFGTTQASTTSQPGQTFGFSTPATTASAGLTLGAPAATSAGLSFGLGSTATTKPTLSFGTSTSVAATSVPSLLSFSTPKTTATTGFSLSVSAGGTATGTGAGSLFSLPTTSAPTTGTSTAPAPFKGLGGVDTSASQGSGQKDTKSVKENVVNPEITQTLDVFKNFVKQQKNLSCEVSRAPVKPMHKVTEDTDALNKLLTSVSSALQKNRIAANKLKNDTTKCLSLCEMAQRTHDTPPGLQNDNVAPLQFFIQLVSKFEHDIQVLRQEIDNTEKHVNSLSYPAILTPQELSTALRRLHDSFVALAGRLQVAHAGVTTQKERHLGLRRHFLKDHTNIFDTSIRTAVPRKPQCAMPTPRPGPTPFSSMGGFPNISLMGEQDKTVTFSTGASSFSGWGTSNISSLNPNSTSTFLQSPGTSILSSPQPVDNQNFQLGKPPPGNKRGKR